MFGPCEGEDGGVVGFVVDAFGDGGLEVVMGCRVSGVGFGRGKAGSGWGEMIVGRKLGLGIGGRGMEAGGWSGVDRGVCSS